jgi:hypothetical protein
MQSDEWSWRFWPLVPIYPYGKRRTLRTEVVPNQIWTFDQVQGIFYVSVPIRMTVVRLAAGGLLVYAPVAPTPECLRLMQELVAQHGDVKYIVLPTVSGLEHKVFVPAFARQFAQAQIFVAPQQWSFPLNLPLSWLGFPAGRTQVLAADSGAVPFADEFDYAVLMLNLGLGWFGEVALCHRGTGTLLLTDTVVSVPEDPPAIVQLDPYPLLFHARDRNSDELVDTPAHRRKGWQRIALFAFFFRPSVLHIADLIPSLQEMGQARDRSRRAYFGWYPFRWQPHWQQSFQALRGNGRLLVAPILQQLILNRAPSQVLDWVKQVSQWEFQQIIPCHLDAPLSATPQQFQHAFAFLALGATANPATLDQFAPKSDFAPPPEHIQPLIAADFALLKQLDAAFSQLGILPPIDKVHK